MFKTQTVCTQTRGLDLTRPTFTGSPEVVLYTQFRTSGGRELFQSIAGQDVGINSFLLDHASLPRVVKNPACVNDRRRLQTERRWLEEHSGDNGTTTASTT